MSTLASQKLYERAVESIPAGTHSNSRFRSPHPLYFSQAEGPYIWDVDGNRYIDCVMGNGAVILGHNHPAVREAIEKQLETGINGGLETELSVALAEKFLSLVSTAEMVRFTNTGTEAAMHAIMMARAYTGRQDVAKVEGAYNGWYDCVHVSTWPDLTRAGAAGQPVPLPGTAGLDDRAVESTVVLPFNDSRAAERILRANQDRLAAVILEPVMIDIGFIPAKKEYLETIRAVTEELGIVLIFDELLTGFRLARGGAQEYYGITPDLSIFGKALTDGQIMAAVAGQRRFMDVSAPGPGRCAFVGTYNGHQVSVAAGMATLDILADGRVISELDRKTQDLKEEFRRLAAKYGVPARMQGQGGHFQWYFNSREVTNYREAAASDREAYAVFQSTLMERGIYTSANYLLHHALSYTHGEEVLAELVTAMDEGLRRVAAGSQVRGR